MAAHELKFSHCSRANYVVRTFRGILDLVGTEYLCNMISKPSQLSSISNTPSCFFQFLFDFIVIPYGLVLVQAIWPLIGSVLFDPTLAILSFTKALH